MCTNFTPTANDMLVQFGVERAPFDYKAEAYPGYDAPIVIHIMRRAGTASDADDIERESEANTKRECIPARFGLIHPIFSPKTSKVLCASTTPTTPARKR